MVAKITLSERYALPSPLTYNSLSDQLVMSTFEYEVIGLEFGGLLTTTTQEVTPKWTFCLNDRIQQLDSGRFFASDSAVQGEVMVALPRQLLWFSHEGKLLRELDVEHPIISVAPVQPARYNAYGKHPVIVSQMVLLRGGQVLLVHNGSVAWVGAYGDAAVQPLQNLMLPQLAAAQEEPCMSANCSTQEQTRDCASEQKTENVAKQLVDFPIKRKQLNYPIIIASPQALTPVFSGNSAAPQIFPQQPGLFLIMDQNAVSSICLFGIKTDKKSLLPLQLPESEVSKKLREELQTELKILREKNSQGDIECLKIEAKLVQIKPQDRKLATTFEVMITSDQQVTDVIIAADTLSRFEIQFTCQESRGKYVVVDTVNPMQPMKMRMDLLISKGQFVSAQQIWFIVSGKTINEHQQEVTTRAETVEQIPLFSYMSLDVAPGSIGQQMKHKIELNFKVPFNSLSALLSKPGFSPKLIEKLQTSQGVLAVQQPNGNVCFLQQQSQFQAAVVGNQFETMFLAVELLQQMDLEFVLKVNSGEFAVYFVDFLQQKAKLQQAQLEAEDYLQEQVAKFQEFNTALGTQFFEQESPVLTLTINSHFQNPAEETEAHVQYLEALIKRVKQKKQEVDTYDQRLKGLLLLVAQCSSREGLKEQICYCDTAVIKEAIYAAAEQQGDLQQAVEKLLE